MNTKTFVERVIGLPRNSKRSVAIAVDIGLCALTSYLAVYLRLGEIPASGGPLWIMIAGSVIIALPIFHAFGFYRAVLSQSGVFALTQMARACGVYGLIFASVFTFGGVVGIPRTTGIIQPILVFLFVSASRLFARYWLGDGHTRTSTRPSKRVLVYGAGRAGRQLNATIRQGREFEVVGFLDDDAALQGRTIDATPILPPRDVANIVARLGVSEVLLALPSITRYRRNQIIADIREIAVHVRTLPGFMDVARGRVTMSDLRELDIEDLLGRDVVAPDPELIGARVRGKTVMITGAGGSIGGELCRQVLNVGPANLLLIDAAEFALYTIHRELSAHSEVDASGIQLVPLLGSVLDKKRMRDIIEFWRPDIIYHAAAYKHVPLVEQNVCQGVRNNLFGTLTVCEVARDCGVADFVLISTDKAVRPTNVMGATKRAAELVLQAFDKDGGPTRFSMVRFGNVLGSSGSVVPLFRRQIRNGGPVTVTDKRITRYFMTIPEAAQLVVQASAMAQGGEVFVLDMGEPVKIVNLARNLIELSGLTVLDRDNPNGDIEIEEIGLRSGEKLYEELLIGENPTQTQHPRIFKAHEHHLSLKELRLNLKCLADTVDRNDVADTIIQLRLLVPEFSPEGKIVDWLHEASDSAEKPNELKNLESAQPKRQAIL